MEFSVNQIQLGLNPKWIIVTVGFAVKKDDGRTHGGKIEVWLPADEFDSLEAIKKAAIRTAIEDLSLSRAV